MLAVEWRTIAAESMIERELMQELEQQSYALPRVRSVARAGLTTGEQP